MHRPSEIPGVDPNFLDHALLTAEIETPVCLDESVETLDDLRTALALKAGEALARTIRARLERGEVEVRLRGPPPGAHQGKSPGTSAPGAGESPPMVSQAPPEAPQGTPGWLSTTLLLALAASLLIALPRAVGLGALPSGARLVAVGD